ncbi:MAG: hypothetical protein OEQ13_02160 [Acidobacteriota bacterium]|nr:hypothetical protein [Acidobacteriota bacterium]
MLDTSKTIVGRGILLASFAAAAFGVPAMALPEEAPPPPFSDGELQAAHDQLVEMLDDVQSPKERTERIVRIALYERPTGALGQLVEQAFRQEAPTASNVLHLVFREGEPYAQARILDLFREEWNLLGRGGDSWRWDMVARGLDSPHDDVREAAARLAASRPIHQIGHRMIDTTLERPELTLATLLAIDVTRDWHTVRWVLDHLEHEDPVVRQAARRAVQSIGRPAAEHLRERMDKADGERRAMLVTSLLSIAIPDDIALLYRWLESHGSAHPDLAEQVSAALAQLDIGNYAPERLERPEFVIPTTREAATAAKSAGDAR